MRHGFRVLLLLAITASAARAESELHYKIPDGWADVMSPTFIAGSVPQIVMRDAGSRKYALFAVDPHRATRESAPVSFNVVEVTSSGKVTLGAVRQGAVEMQQQLSGKGTTVNLDEIKVIKLNDVDIGFVSSLVETRRGSLRMLQYMIPGRTKLAVLTYVCPIEDSDHYRPIFESSAMATTGAYDHSGFTGGSNFTRIWFFGALAAIIAVIVTLIRASGDKPRAAITTQTASTPAAWDCPNCKRRVPMRVTQCRCGTPQPV
jgi:hypothetical protein